VDIKLSRRRRKRIAESAMKKAEGEEGCKECNERVLESKSLK
jgi:hypothetical protein